MEKDRLRGSPYLLYNWSLRGDPVSTPFVSRCWRPAFGQGKLSRAPNKISTTESPPAQALEQRQFNPPSNLLDLHRLSQLPSGETYQLYTYLPAYLRRRLLKECLYFSRATKLTPSLARSLHNRPIPRKIQQDGASRRFLQQPPQEVQVNYSHLRLVSTVLRRIGANHPHLCRLVFLGEQSGRSSQIRFPEATHSAC